MSYICLDCGHIFDEGEQKVYRENHGLPGGYYEEFSVCPVCGGDYEEAAHCVSCGGDFKDENLYDGWCEECLVKMISYDGFLLYALDKDLLADFVFEKIFDMEAPTNVSEQLKNWLVNTYQNAVILQERFKEKSLMQLITDFVCVDEYSKYDFAEWLNDKIKKVTKEG